MSDVNSAKKRRSYRSPTRDEGARRTRQAIVTTAAELFTERGYAATSLSDIATVAGVARPTVFASFGSKPALLRQVLDQALAGDDEPVAVADRPWYRPVWDATTPGAVLDAYAEVCVLIGGRAARLFEVVRQAADDGPEVAELWTTLQRNRRIGAKMVVDHVRTLGDLAPGLDTDTAADALWVFNDPALYAALVLQRGWAEDTFRRWLAHRMRDALLTTF
ncbi:MAG: TetR/AcrR family transcriptional regulator [Hamadaea sp.]|uniref:TetR/AcrR family transcriptional regulator n=1 Tax=Hamadaea sp. TaxID=2024425 RepID=UPI00181DDF37|nr:TetR/AcrR family transcriptional regulator [Hamadaea sp.]NUT18768.1 TetR/AcrR family transcriptional regulator [Hamadaea sp.]